jgi:hypothetical protein
MKPWIKQAIAVAAAVFLLALAYYGSYLPFRKSQLFIAALRSLNAIRSLNDFKAAFDKPLKAPSPIGQEELVRNMGSTVINVIISTQNDDPKDLIAALVEYLEEYYRPIMERRNGMSFTQNLVVLAAANQEAFIRTGEPRYFEAAKRYYEEGLRRGPDRPQFLYGVFDMYRLERNAEGIKRIGERILKNWPTDDRVRNAITAQDFGTPQETAKP